MTTTPKPLRAFRGTISKPRLLKTLRRHAAQDAFTQGVYWEGNGDGRGCAVGCTLHDFACGRETEHALYEPLFGIPQILARLEDRIFEGLPQVEAKLWPQAFVKAITPGVDLTRVWPRFAVWLLTNEVYGVLRHARTEAQREAIQIVADLYELQLVGAKVAREDWEEAKQNAYAAASVAAYTAASVAVTAAYAAYAADAAAADAAAAAAANAANAAARYTWYRAAAKQLLVLLEAA